MMATYRNPFYTPGKAQYGPAEYQTDVEPEEYRGFLIYRRLSYCWDIVKDGTCIGQYAGRRGARDQVDNIKENPSEYWAARSLRWLEPQP